MMSPAEWDVVRREAQAALVAHLSLPMQLAGCASIDVYTDGSAPLQNPGGPIGFAAIVVGCAPRQATGPTVCVSASVTVVQTVLCPGTMVFQVRNDGAQPVTLAQVSVNDAFWPFTASPGATLAPHGTAVVTLRYPWDAGVAYEVGFMSATGVTFVTDISATTTASAPPCP